MKIDDILSAADVKVDHRLHYVSGVIKADEQADWFRVYPFKGNVLSYLRIQRSDVKGEIYEWSEQEMAAAGIVASKFHRVPVSLGTNVDFVKIEPHRIGETISSSDFNPQAPGCKATSGCSQQCCETAFIGEPCYCSTCCIARKGTEKTA